MKNVTWMQEYDESKMLIHPDDYHVIMLFQRKKDIPDLSRSTKCVFQDLAKASQIREKIDMYRRLAEELNARVYISASPRDLRNARKRLLIRLIQTEDDGNDETNIQRQMMGALMESPSRAKKKFVIDVDTDSGSVYDTLVSLFPHHQSVKTKNGYHFIVPPFDLRIVSTITGVEVKKDGMTDISYIEKYYSEGSS